MSIFASQVTKVVSIPGAEPHTMTIRRLSGGEFAEVIQLFKADSPVWRNKAIGYGVTEWSLSEARTVEAMADLVDEAVDAVALEVMKLTKPAWFTTKDEADAAEKND